MVIAYYSNGEGDMAMSLQIGLNNYGSINQYSGYTVGASAAASAGNTSANEQVTGAISMQNDKLMKRIGAVECKTCQSRKYVDGSNDPGVSFKTPTHVSAAGSGAAVMAHEQEHVSRNNAKAQAEDREIVAQSVQIYTDVCPECGRVYASGGKTTTVSKADNNDNDYFMENMRKSMGKYFGKYFDAKA